MVGEIKKYKFQNLVDIWYLFSGQLSKMRRYKNFKTFQQLSSFAKNTNDVEFINQVQIVRTYTTRIPIIVEKIEKQCKYNEKVADYVFTTAHKAKGLEWKTVILLDDFLDITIMGLNQGLSPEARDTDDEKNLLYVAMTRAKINLVLNYSLFNLMVNGGDLFEKVVKMEEIKSKEEKLTCPKCLDDLLLENNVFGLGCIETKSGKCKKKTGFFCSNCSTSNHFLELNIEQNSYVHKKFEARNREFLRYFVGVLPDKYQAALSLIEQVNERRREREWDDWGAHMGHINMLLDMPFDVFGFFGFEDDSD